MAICVGLDVSQRVTEICVIDGEGHRLWRGQCASDLADIATMLAQHAPGAIRIGRRAPLRSGYGTASENLV